MLRIEVRFPLGVYHALSPESFGRVEWPPSPVRLIGALLAATHESETVETVTGRAVLELICAAEPPEVVAPLAQPFDDPTVDGSSVVAEIRGASRWAPRNREGSELKKRGVSFRRLGGDQTEVFKGGAVVGDQVVEFRWPAIELAPKQLEALRMIAAEATFLGTSRSPVLVTAHGSASAEDHPAWHPDAEAGISGTEVRVPTPSLLEAFDNRHRSRNATGKKPVQNTGHVANVGLGSTLPYRYAADRESFLANQPLTPERWGDMLILQLDAEPDGDGSGSEILPKASAAYLLARAFRSALLNTYDAVGTVGEAPPILRGHGAEPHAAFVPLPTVGTVASKVSRDGKRTEIDADGLIRGIAIVLPHEELVPDVAIQRLRVEDGLHRFVLGDDREAVRLPGGGRIRFRLTPPGLPPLRTLEEPRYRGPSQSWETITPVVHARRRTSTGPQGIIRQVGADCAFAGLPQPNRIEVLKDPPFAGAPHKPLGPEAVPPDWRSSMAGPHSHLRLAFDQPIEGPVLLGRAAHFGLGLCRPARSRGTDEATGNEPRSTETEAGR